MGASPTEKRQLREAAALNHIAKCGDDGVGINELARVLRVSKPILEPILDDLVERFMVVRINKQYHTATDAETLSARHQLYADVKRRYSGEAKAARHVSMLLRSYHDGGRTCLSAEEARCLARYAAFTVAAAAVAQMEAHWRFGPGPQYAMSDFVLASPEYDDHLKLLRALALDHGTSVIQALSEAKEAVRQTGEAPWKGPIVEDVLAKLASLPLSA